MVSLGRPDLWTVALERQHIDPVELRAAIEAELARQPLDFRTRALIREAISALEISSGAESLAIWRAGLPHQGLVAEILSEPSSQVGFPSLRQRIMEPTRIDTVYEFFRELGQALNSPVSVDVGGSVALILHGALSRRTEDIDLVDEIPLLIRAQHDLLDVLAKRYGLRLTHFQSHYLPSGWEGRVESHDNYQNLHVNLVDVSDIFLGKLFSAREKDRDDLRVLKRVLDRQTIERQFVETTVLLRKEPPLLQNATNNWYILFGTQLPL